MGRLYLQNDQYDDALANFQIAWSLEPPSETYFRGVVNALIAKKEFKEGLRAVDVFLARSPENARAYSLRSVLYLKLGLPDQAHTALRRAIEIKPEWKKPYLQLGSTLLSQQNTSDEAISVLRKGYIATGSNEDVGMLLGAAQIRTNDMSGAIQTYEAILERNPNNLIAANNFASSIADFYPNDRTWLDRALKATETFQASTQAPFLDTLGRVHYRLGNIKKAVSYLEQATNKAPKSDEIKIHLASAYIKDGQISLARENLQTVVKRAKNPATKQSARKLLDTLVSTRRG